VRGRMNAVFLLGALSAGCVEPLEVAHVLTGPPLPAKADGAPIPVFINQTPGRPYREVAQIRIRATGESAEMQTVLDAAAQDAREVGADAIIVDARRHYHSVQVWFGCDERPRVDPDWRLNARVTAIQFTPPGAASPEPAPTGPPLVREPCE
jgi:hypothetical protein